MQSDERHSPVPVPVSHPALMNGNSDSNETSQSSSTAQSQSRSSQSIPSHCVQTFVHSPQPQLATHPIAYTPPLMLYPTQPAFITHSSHSGFTGTLTGQSPLHVLPRPPPQRLLELPEAPQDLSMKSATVTA
ncbi:uncharacterized protein LOC117103610 [Anneissia japonica]|uniref:uncharacterized protein LOC117103610 n=1 Tax=Anneissia japonica TaxID=1529436 RepID=UPI00142581BF|nr:uncharacterized protein LOC117103610 [Anneissia japonica]